MRREEDKGVALEGEGGKGGEERRREEEGEKKENS